MIVYYKVKWNLIIPDSRSNAQQIKQENKQENKFCIILSGNIC